MKLFKKKIVSKFVIYGLVCEECLNRKCLLTPIAGPHDFMAMPDQCHTSKKASPNKRNYFQAKYRKAAVTLSEDGEIEKIEYIEE